MGNYLQTNIGLDFGFFNNRINGEIDIYNKDTKDLLLYAEVPVRSVSLPYNKISEVSTTAVLNFLSIP